VFDVCRHIHVVEAERDRILAERDEIVENSDCPAERATRLVEMGVHEIVCGAISGPLRAMIMGHGIGVIPFVSGDLSQVVQAWLSNRLNEDVFRMPGCCGALRTEANLRARARRVRTRGGAGRMRAGSMLTTPGPGSGRTGNK
jgi:predicted Fe-Mo cluster-binding NifX family protein